MSEVTWVIPDRLARGYRPGRTARQGPAPRSSRRGVKSALEAGIRSILCLLADEQLELYAGVPGGLLDYYRTRGFKVEHVPVADYKTPPLDHAELHKVWEAFRRCQAPSWSTAPRASIAPGRPSSTFSRSSRLRSRPRPSAAALVFPSGPCPKRAMLTLFSQAGR